MIGMLKGFVADKEIDRIIIDVSGVGYEAYATLQDISVLSLGDPIQVFVYEQIREEAHDLYGFTQKSDKQLFERLISVKNVGPKVALSVLNLGPSARIKQAIAGGEVDFLKSAKGVGKRAAEQLIVELRDKVGLISSGDAEDIITRRAFDPNDEAVMALVSLGYSEADAAKALSKVDSGLDTAEKIKLVLKG